ncbi:MAG TPA: glycosyltransferase family 39 protein [bacterium]|nr:glycosyltransferase family 39 protein [bacterium]
MKKRKISKNLSPKNNSEPTESVNNPIQCKPSSDSEKKNKTKIFIFYCIVLFLISAVLNWVLLTQYKRHPLFNFINKVTDSYAFFENGKNLANSGFIGKGKFNQEPGYYYYLAAAIKLFGADVYKIRVFQSITGSLTVVLVFIFSYFLFDSIAAGLSASILLLFCGAQYYYNFLILRTFLIPFQIFLCLTLLIIFYKTNNLKALFSAGLLAGAAFLTRPNSISFIISSIICIIFFYKTNRKKMLLYFISGIVLIFCILGIRNISAGAGLLSFSDKGAAEFASGNIIESNGVGWIEHPKSNEYAEKHKNLSAVIFRVVLDSIKANPAAFIKLQLNKIAAALNNYEIPNNYNFYYFKNYYIPNLKYFPVNFGIIFIFFAMGIIVLTAKQNNSEFNLIKAAYLSTLVLYFFSVTSFYVISRFRYPVLVLMIPCAGLGASSFIKNILKRNFVKSGIQTLAGIAAGLIAFYYPVDGFNKNFDAALAYANDGAAYSELNLTGKSIERYKKALDYYPAEIGFATIIKLFIKTGDFVSGSEYSKKGLNLYPRSADLNYLAAFNFIKLQNHAESVNYLLKIPEIENFKNFKLYNLALEYYYLNDYNASLVYWEKYYILNPSDDKARLNIINLKLWQSKQKNLK